MSALNDMFDNASVEYRENESIYINLDSKMVSIDLKTLATKCEEDLRKLEDDTNKFKKLYQISITFKFYPKSSLEN